MEAQGCGTCVSAAAGLRAQTCSLGAGQPRCAWDMRIGAAGPHLLGGGPDSALHAGAGGPPQGVLPQPRELRGANAVGAKLHRFRILKSAF